MGREHRWTVELDGQTHTILCEEKGNQYVLWADDDHVTTIYRKQFQNERGGIDEGVTLFGRPCRFVVWEEQLEFFLDGASLTGRGPYPAAKRRHDRAVRNGLLVVCVLSLAAAAGFLCMALTGADVIQWRGVFVFAALCAVGSLTLICRMR